MATSWIERQVISQLYGHASEVGIDIVKHQLASRKGLKGSMRKQGLLEELKPLASFDEQSVNSCPALTALSTCTGNCIHCIQDTGVGLFDPSSDSCMYLVSTDNCDLHRFYGDCAVERFVRERTARVRGCFGASQHATGRERLPSLSSALTIIYWLLVSSSLSDSAQNQIGEPLGTATHVVCALSMGCVTTIRGS